MSPRHRVPVALIIAALAAPGEALCQTARAATPTPAPAARAGAAPPVVVGGWPLPPDYVIGPDDILSVVFWRDKELSTDVIVRPDGRITLPLLNDVMAAGLTPEQLRDLLVKEALRYIEGPNATVMVKEMNSRKVFITGQVEKPGSYPLRGPMTVMQLIATAGGLREYAKAGSILVMRKLDNRQVAYKFNYNDVFKRKNLEKNIELKPGDIVVVP